MPTRSQDTVFLSGRGEGKICLGAGFPVPLAFHSTKALGPVTALACSEEAVGDRKVGPELRGTAAMVWGLGVEILQW